MRFNRLRLNGFKSFVDPTELVIADGLTGVVGPNGCGKSNLLEALRWVMGENRPTAMRGAGMEDVIFAGTAGRPARNFAEVVLALDNSERTAPAGFNDADLIEITRRITRDAGSAYKVNQKDVRARDVQMLFADASTGAHSPALVRQGQISELINARPRARRVILEEAAGISGLYARRHEAELRLSATEQNLARVDDVISQLAGQLSQLARQARQAGRYREIGVELRRAEGAHLWRRWREADAARVLAEQSLAERDHAAAQSARAAEAAALLREAAEAGLPPLREEEAIAAALLQRLMAEREALAGQEAQAIASIAALDARVAQLGRDLEREAALNHDAGESMARLMEEAEALAEADEGADAALEQAADLAEAATEILDDREEAQRVYTDELGRLAARHQSAERLIEDSRKTLVRSDAEASKAAQQLAQVQAVLQKAEADFAAAAAAQAEARDQAEEAEAILAETDAARSDTQAHEADARAERSEVEGELNALVAEATGLARLVARDDTGGQVLDLITVAPGYEKAIGAALADDLKAPLVGIMRRSGWAQLPDYKENQPLPAGAVPLAEKVKVPGVLSRRMAQTGLIAAHDGDRLQAQLLPGQRLVSIEGDLWRWDGLRAAAADAPSAAALRLQQLNRIETLRREQAEVEARAAAARQAHDALRARLAELTEADRGAREARRAADQRLTEGARHLSKLEAERNIAAGRVESLRLSVARHEDEARAAEARLAEAERARAELPDLVSRQAATEEVKIAVEAARVTMLMRRAALDELRRETAARGRRREAIASELATWQARLENAGLRLAELTERREAAIEELGEARQAPQALEAQRAKLTSRLAEAEARRSAAQAALGAAEAALRQAVSDERDAERLAGEAREARARAEAKAEAARDSASSAASRIAEELETTPNQLLGLLGLAEAEVPSAQKLEDDIARLRRNRDQLGAVNLRAEEDAREIQTEHDHLVQEKSDLEAAIAKLRAGISALNREGRERLLTAFDQVNSNFSMLFKHLFGGGEARLTLVESDDPLEAGLEILCQPPGKKLSVLSLLSGGEQTLTAMALIFAVFLANPAPICVLDEVDAPLDDANVGRFCDLLDEMTRQTSTRFLIITHHAVTMSRMDRLFGVTMGEKGVSQLVSVDLRKAEALVA